MRWRLDPFALYGVPIASGLITGAVLLGSARERPAFGARVYGFVAEGATRVALRVHVRQHLRGSFSDFAAPVEVRVSAGGQALGAAEAGAASMSEVVVPLSSPVSGPLDVRVTARGVELARTTIEPRAPLTPGLPPAAKRGEAGSQVTVTLVRGFAVPELPERLDVTVEADAGPELSIAAEAMGADLARAGGPEVACEGTRCRTTWPWTITSRAPAVELDVKITRDGAPLISWAGPINVAPGRLWLDPDTREQLRIRSAFPRDEAFVSLIATTGRFFGARVALATDDAGTSHGALPVPELPEGPVVVLLSSEPNEPEVASASWPLEKMGLSGGRVEMFADGMPAAVRADKERRSHARRPAYALIVAAGLFELVYLWWRTRRSRRRLEQHLASHTGGEVTAAQSLPLTALVVLSGALALAFAVLATLSALG